MNNQTAQTWACIGVTLIVVHLLVLFSIRPYGYDYSAMIRLSSDTATDTVAPEYIQKGMVVFDRGGGYDGQAYYYVAMDPFLTIGHYKDGYRQQRVVYPLAARLAAFNDVRLLPYSLYCVNLIALAVGVYFFILLLRRFSLSPFWSLFYGLAPPSIMTIQYDLPSALCLALIIAAVYFYLEDNLPLTAVLFALAFLTREDTVVVFAPLFVWEAHSRRSLKRAGLLAASLLPFFLWQEYIFRTLGTLPTAESSTVISFVPFSGIYGHLKTFAGAGAKDALKGAINIFIFVWLMALLVLMGWRLVKTRHPFYYVTLAYALLAVITVPSQWNNFNGLLRIFYGVFPFLVLSYGVERSVPIRYAGYFIGVLTALTIVRVLFVSPVYSFVLWQ
ncbi:MAG: hypothetical protein HZB85_04410 [Deltaproteobacteria bacterium]|nr:hypothetical protein [Deltaproteobacteria bacterium]